MVSAYVLVDVNPSNTVIISGPVLWDGASPFTAPSGQQILAEAVALANGYTYPGPSTAEIVNATISSRAVKAIATNIAYLAIPSPTNAQAVTQVNALTKEVTAIIRLILNQLASTSGT